MLDLIERNRDRIADLCRRHGVRRLDLFGSAARGEDFDPATSDADFLYEFDPADRSSVADRFFGLLDDLETALDRPVDLTSVKDAKGDVPLRQPPLQPTVLVTRSGVDALQLTPPLDPERSRWGGSAVNRGRRFHT